MELLLYVGERIRDLRTEKGLSQEALAERVKTTANTISRWETGTYRPSLEDLDQLSRVFGVSILEFFPAEKPPVDERVAALLRAARELPESDIEELQKYAEFRRARVLFAAGKRKPGRPSKRK